MTTRTPGTCCPPPLVNLCHFKSIRCMRVHAHTPSPLSPLLLHTFSIRLSLSLFLRHTPSLRLSPLSLTLSKHEQTCHSWRTTWTPQIGGWCGRPHVGLLDPPTRTVCLRHTPRGMVGAASQQSHACGRMHLPAVAKPNQTKPHTSTTTAQQGVRIACGAPAARIAHA